MLEGRKNLLPVIELVPYSIVSQSDPITVAKINIINGEQHSLMLT